MHAADLSRADQFAGAGVVRPRPLLRADLHDPLRPRRDGLHPLALADEQCERLLDVHVLPRTAGHDRHERVPVVGRGHDDGVDVAPIEQASEVGLGRGRAAGERPRCLDPRRRDGRSMRIT